MSDKQESDVPSDTRKSQDLYTNSAKDFRPNKFEDFGYFFYPQRFGNIVQPKWYEKFFSYGKSRELLNKSLCEQNVENCIEKHPGVKLLLSAMKSIGCEANILRHFSCEYCDKAVKGGFDPSTNQSILCYNTIENHSKDEVAKELMSSLLQSYDYCRTEYNMFDLRHLACTQVRAANLTSCSVMDAIANDSALFHFKEAQKECVRRKAALSLQMVRNITEAEAYRAVDHVFDRCYNDTEPFGRRVLNENDCERAYRDRKRFGFN